eukprot:8594601-Alexandrium_andersonii.AAC.1
MGAYPGASRKTTLTGHWPSGPTLCRTPSLSIPCAIHRGPRLTEATGFYVPVNRQFVAPRVSLPMPSVRARTLSLIHI